MLFFLLFFLFFFFPQTPLSFHAHLSPQERRHEERAWGWRKGLPRHGPLLHARPSAIVFYQLMAKNLGLIHHAFPSFIIAPLLDLLWAVKHLSAGDGDAGKKSSNGSGGSSVTKHCWSILELTIFQKLSITSLNRGAQIIKGDIISGKCCEIYKDK